MTYLMYRGKCNHSNRELSETGWVPSIISFMKVKTSKLHFIVNQVLNIIRYFTS
jgi:hypothetical protein